MMVPAVEPRMHPADPNPGLRPPVPRAHAPQPGAGTASWCVVLAAIVLVVFWPAADDGFVFDDYQTILENSLLQRGFTREGVFFSFFGAYGSNWHPLTWLSHLLDVELFGLDPGPRHVVNLLLHAANAALLLALLRGWTGRLRPSLAAAVLFALHPLRVESVAWISERKDLLCGFFWLLAFHAHLGHARRPGLRRSLLLAIAVALSLMAKPMAVTLPIALLLADFWPLDRLRSNPRAALLEKIPLLVLALFTGLMTISAQRLGGALRSMEAYPLAERIANAVLSLGLYLRNFFLPLDLGVFYTYRRLALHDPRVLISATLLLAISACALIVWRRAPWLAMGWGWYLLTVAPTLGLIQVGDQALADRYTYLPLLGGAVALVWGAGSLRPAARWARPTFAAVALGATLLSTVLTRRQLGFWDDPELLFRRAMAVSPGNWKAMTLLGTELERKGKRVDAEASYRSALALNPSHGAAHFNLGGLLIDAGRPEEAVPHYQQVLRRNPWDNLARQHLALALSSLGREEEVREVSEGPAPHEEEAAR